MQLNSRRQNVLTVALCACLVASPAFGETRGLAQLYETALAQDPVYHAEISRLKAVKSEYPISRADLLPQIGLSASKVRNEDTKIIGRVFGTAENRNRSEFPAYTADSYSLELTQTLFDMRKFMQLSRSGKLLAQAEIQERAALQALILRLAEAYFEALLAHTELMFIRAEKKTVTKQLDEAQSRYSVGLVAHTDVKEAQAAYDLVGADEIEAESALDDARHALVKIVGHDVQSLRLLSENFPVNPPEPQDPEQWVEVAYKNNPALLSRQLDAVIALKDVKLESADHWPKLELFASKSHNDIQGGPAPNSSFHEVWGVRINVPIFSGGATHYRTKQASARHRQSLEQLEEQYRESRRFVRRTYMNLIADVKRIGALRQARLSAQASLDANEEGFRVGTRTSAEVLLALRDLFETERDLASARHTYVLDTLRLKSAVGGLNGNDIARIEQWLE